MPPPRLPEKKKKGASALSATAVKRLRVPAVDLDANPFCQDRQLADELALMALNKNPQLHAPTAAAVLARLDAAAAAASSGAHHGVAPPPPRPFGRRSAIEAATDASGPEGFDAITTHGILQAATASAARREHAMEKRRGGGGGSGGAGGSQRLSSNRPAPKVPTFGHRPGSASRHFAPASGGRTKHVPREAGANGAAGGSAGMSFAELQHMLGGGKAPFDGLPPPAMVGEGKGSEDKVIGKVGAPTLGAPPSTLGGDGGSSGAAAAAAAFDDTYDPLAPSQPFTLEAQTWTPEDLGAEFLETHPDVLDTLHSLEPRTAARQRASAARAAAAKAREEGFNNTIYQTPLVRPDIVNFGPDPSEGYRHRIERFRARAAGSTRHPLCEGKQANDAKQMAAGPTPLPMAAFGGNENLDFAPPKDKRQRDEAAHIKTLMAKERSRQARLEKRLRQHTRMAADDRIVEQMSRKERYGH